MFGKFKNLIPKPKSIMGKSLGDPNILMCMFGYMIGESKIMVGNHRDFGFTVIFHHVSKHAQTQSTNSYDMIHWFLIFTVKNQIILDIISTI